MMSPTASSGSSTTRRPDVFSLSGPTKPLDPRDHAFRNDLADVALAGIRFAPHYAKAEPTDCVLSSTMVLGSPSEEAQSVSQLVYGEGFALLDRSGTWAWGRCEHDGYVGYVRAEALGPREPRAWRVIAPLAPGFATGSIKAPVVAHYPIGSLLSGLEAGEFVRTDGRLVHHRHVQPTEAPIDDWVASAERLVGLPYLWGGRGAGGIDCSGLVQVALGLGGIAAPRDSDQQRETLGDRLPADAVLKRGDLVFLLGHVGIMADETRLLHANAFWMAVTIEPLAAVVERAGPAEVVRKRIAR